MHYFQTENTTSEKKGKLRGYRFRMPLKRGFGKKYEVSGVKVQYAVTTDTPGCSLLYACFTRHRTFLGDTQQWHSN